MELWQAVVGGLGLGVALVLLYGAALVFRRRWIARDGGTFDLSLRTLPARTARGWVLGVGRYSGDRLDFFRVFSVLPRPMTTLRRSELGYLGQRVPVGAEAHALYAGHVIVACSRAAGNLELAMAAEAVTGFLAWLESAPPGARPLPT